MSKYKFIHAGKCFIIQAFLMMVAATCIFPLLWMVRSALMTKETIFTEKSLLPAVMKWGNFAEAWISGNFGVYFLNSFFYTIIIIFGVVVISSLAAYAFSRLQFPGRDIIYFIFFIAMIIPLPGGFVPLVAVMNKLGFVDTRYGYILCMINVQLSISIVIYKTFFDKMSKDLEDAARIDGCGRLEVWWHVARPLSRPATAVVVILGVMTVWNEFILAQLLLTSDSLMTLQTGLYKFQGPNLADYPVLMAGLTIAALPIILVYLVMQKYIMKGLSSGVVG